MSLLFWQTRQQVPKLPGLNLNSEGFSIIPSTLRSPSPVGLDFQVEAKSMLKYYRATLAVVCER